MLNIFNKNYQSVGNTPLVQLLNFLNEVDNNNLFAKVESRNPAFSVKDRVAYSMIIDALKSGLLKENMEIIEPTSGNTGIALSMVGASLNFTVNIVMPETMSNERKKLISALGAKLILTDGQKGMKGAIDKARILINENPGKYYMPDQFSNPSNPKIHELTTGPEISHALDEQVDIIVAGVGTGGTITGISQYFKKVCNKQMKTIEIFDPAMCCPTGLCGPNINPELMRMATVTETLKRKGINITRHNLKDEPQAFVSNSVVNKYLQEKGADALPITLVDGEIVLSKDYPTNKQLSEWTGVPLDFIPVE